MSVAKTTIEIIGTVVYINNRAVKPDSALAQALCSQIQDNTRVLVDMSVKAEKRNRVQNMVEIAKTNLATAEWWLDKRMNELHDAQRMLQEIV